MANVYEQWVDGFAGTTVDTSCSVTTKSSWVIPSKNAIVCAINKADNAYDTAYASITSSSYLPQTDEGRLRFRFYTGSRAYGTNNHTILMLNNGDPASVIDLYITSGGKIGWWSDAGTFRSTSTGTIWQDTTLANETEYNIELRWKGATNGTGFKELFVNGAQQTNTTGSDTPSSFTMVAANDCDIASARVGIDHYDGADTSGFTHMIRWLQIDDSASATLADPAVRIPVTLDGHWYRSNAVYANVAGSSPGNGQSSNTANYATREYDGGGPLYYITNLILRSVTGSYIPDGSTVTSAGLWFYLLTGGANTDDLKLVGDWYDPSTSVDSADWANLTDDASSDAVTGTLLSALVESQPNVVTLANVDNITVAGETTYTGLRLGVSKRSADAAPTGMNGVEVAAIEHTTYSEPYLEVVYTDAATSSVTAVPATAPAACSPPGVSSGTAAAGHTRLLLTGHG